jgi:hypothetical protein
METVPSFNLRVLLGRMPWSHNSRVSMILQGATVAHNGMSVPVLRPTEQVPTYRPGPYVDCALRRRDSQLLRDQINRSRAISEIKFFRSSSRTAVNFSPIPYPLACLTVASARIVPSCTRKCRFVLAPIFLGCSVSMKTPPTLRSRTRATSSRPSHRQ